MKTKNNRGLQPLRERGGSPRIDAPVVSVCMITYNHRDFIAEAIESVLMQETDFEVEIILHDDCSTDGTADIVKSYAKKYPGTIQAIFQTENQYSRGRKPLPMIFKLASGKYIALLEGDDAWTDPLKLQKQVAFLDDHPDMIVCYGNARTINAAGKILQEHKIPPDRCRDLTQQELMEFTGVMPTASVMFRSHPIVRNMPPVINAVLNGDSFLFGLLAQYGAAGYVSMTPCLYRQQPNGIYSALDNNRKTINSLKTLKSLHQCVAPEYKPWVAGAIARKSIRRAEALRTQRNIRDLVFHVLSFLPFSMMHRKNHFFRDLRRSLGILRKTFFPRHTPGMDPKIKGK